MFRTLLNILYPKYCLECNELLEKKSDYLCSSCHLNLPYVDSVFQGEKSFIHQALRNQCEIKYGFQLFQFSKDSATHELIHQLKYENKKNIAAWLGSELKEQIGEERLQEFDFIVPVPLHKKRLKERGYNQSEEIAKAINPEKINNQVLKRVKNTSTQTKKTKNERQKNMKGAFKVNTDVELRNKKILLVDDVVTTGSTLSSIINTIDQIDKTVQISVATIAYA